MFSRPFAGLEIYKVYLTQMDSLNLLPVISISDQKKCMKLKLVIEKSDMLKLAKLISCIFQQYVNS